MYRKDAERDSKKSACGPACVRACVRWRDEHQLVSTALPCVGWLQASCVCVCGLLFMCVWVVVCVCAWGFVCKQASTVRGMCFSFSFGSYRAENQPAAVFVGSRNDGGLAENRLFYRLFPCCSLPSDSVCVCVCVCVCVFSPQGERHRALPGDQS